MSYNIQDIKSRIEYHLGIEECLRLNKNYIIFYDRDRNRTILQNCYTNGRYQLDDILLCMNENEPLYKGVLPEYIKIHELIKQWYNNELYTEQYYE